MIVSVSLPALKSITVLNKQTVISFSQREQNLKLLATINVGQPGPAGKSADQTVMLEDPLAYYILSKS